MICDRQRFQINQVESTLLNVYIPIRVDIIADPPDQITPASSNLTIHPIHSLNLRAYNDSNSS
jgi:hypothetical protein